ncbi:MAG: ribosomal RNA small subunit methyltransferase A [Acidobacteria bacterium]|nr:MAG: ribosomal RNA small subunit methyltransferase A [Acidobacteriota bacterium]
MSVRMGPVSGSDRFRLRGGSPPKRRYGQHFLSSPAHARSIVERFAPSREDRVVEIGPGRGALTIPLAGRCARLVALEIDPRLAAPLAERLSGKPGVEVRLADALAVDWHELARELGGPLRVIGNLPYNAATPIVRRLLACDAVREAFVMLQLEVAQRFLSPPGRRSYGPLAIVAALRSERRRVAVVPPGAFHPRPRVRSAIVRFSAKDDPPLPAHEIPRLERWLHAGFSARRKTLLANLRKHRDTVARFLEERGLRADARAEALAPIDWLDLARRLEAEGASP